MRLIGNLLENEGARARVKDAGITQEPTFLIEVELDTEEIKQVVAGKKIWLGQTAGGVFAVVPVPRKGSPYIGRSHQADADEEWSPTNAT